MIKDTRGIISNRVHIKERPPIIEKRERIRDLEADLMMGKEFAGHREIAKEFNVKTYFTTLYTSQEKGTVENRIGVIRRFFPKKTDLREVSNERIKQVEFSKVVLLYLD